MDPKAFHSIQYGMYIIGARQGDKLNAQVANTLFQITSEPPTVAVSINKKNLTHEYIQASHAFSASALQQDTPLSFIGQFGFKSGRDTDKLAGIEHRIGKTGSPVILQNAVAYFEVKVTKEFDAGTHTIFWGEVAEAEVLNDKPGMTYGYYQQVKRGTTPKTAPTFIADNKEAKAARYRCTVCGYIYEPDKGDPDGGIKPGTKFEDLPDIWVCPVCGAAKDQFEKLAD